MEAYAARTIRREGDLLLAVVDTTAGTQLQVLRVRDGEQTPVMVDGPRGLMQYVSRLDGNAIGLVQVKNSTVSGMVALLIIAAVLYLVGLRIRQAQPNDGLVWQSLSWRKRGFKGMLAAFLMTSLGQDSGSFGGVSQNAQGGDDANH